MGYVNISPTTNNLVCLTSTTSAGGGNPTATFAFFSAVNGGGTNLGSLTIGMATANDGSYWVTGAYGKVPSGTASIGATYSGGLPGEVHLEAVELSGQDGTSPFISGHTNQQLHPGTTANAITSGTATTTGPAYILGVCNNTNSDADTAAGTGFTLRGTTTSNFAVEDQTQASSGSYAATFTAATHGAGDYYHTFVFAIKAAGTAYNLSAAEGSFTLTGEAATFTDTVAIVKVQAAVPVKASANTSVAITLSGVGAGNLIVIGLAGASASNTLSSIVDSSGNTVSTAQALGGSVVANGIYYVANTSSGTHTITATVSAAENIEIHAVEYRNAATVSPLVATATPLSSSGSTITTNSVTPAANGSLCVFGGTVTGSATLSSYINGFTQESAITSGPTSFFADLVQSTAATVSAGLTQSGTSTWTTNVAVFKPASAGSGTAYSLSAAFGSFSISGQGGAVDSAIGAVQGSYGLTGFAIKIGHGMPALVGSFGITGQDAALVWSGAVSFTGIPKLVVFKLSSISNLIRWVHYIPVQFPVGVSASEYDRFDTSGALTCKVLSSTTGKSAWVDYIPVFVTSDPVSGKWRYDSNGWIPLVQVA